MKRWIHISMMLVVGLSLAGCVKQSNAKKIEDVVVPGGTVHPQTGVGFDVNYDPTLDNIIKGYKIVVVAIANRSMNVVPLDQQFDKWLLIDRKGSKHNAIINLREHDPNAWSTLPHKLKVLIEYPLLLQAGGSQTIDLLFEDSVNLAEFRSVSYTSSAMEKRFHISPREGRE